MVDKQIELQRKQAHLNVKLLLVVEQEKDLTTVEIAQTLIGLGLGLISAKKERKSRKKTEN